MKNQSSSLCLLLALLGSMFFASSKASLGAPAPPIPQTERAALIAFYNATGGPHWTNSTGWLGPAGTECFWFGVGCISCIGCIGNGAHTAVLALDFSSNPAGNNLVGTIPPQIGSLTHLKYLDLFDGNALTGPIPAELGNLTNLTFLRIANSGLTGPIPVELGNLTNLTFINLANNFLTGPIPVELGKLTKLTLLALDGNALPRTTGTGPGLTGPIPAELGNLKNLVSLFLGYNSLTGPIPAELGHLTKLQYLDLSSSDLTGGFPTSLTTLSKLSHLYLNGNNLIGMLPTALTTMRTLSYADLRWNAFQASTATAAFVNAIEPDKVDFRNSQTTPPSSGLAVTGATSSSLTLLWDPILYTSDPGFYSVFMSDSSSGPWALAQQVPGDKSTTMVTLSGLQANMTHYFYLTTTTPPNANNSNNVVSVAGPVFGGATTPGGSFGCIPSAEVLCIDGAPGDGRFRVTATWNNQFDNSSGSAGVVPGTSSTGFLYFTDASNYELIVKILTFSGVVKVFYAELTDLHFTITVTDTMTGNSKSYSNTPGDCGAIDENAFTAAAQALRAAPKSGSCAPTSSTLCLFNQRFAISVSWMNQFNNTSGLGSPRNLSDQSGLFSFTDPTDVELVTKLVDFGDRTAFFWGGLSDFEYDLTVTDTVGGTTKTYHNPPGKYCGGLDNNAFPP